LPKELGETFPVFMVASHRNAINQDPPGVVEALSYAAMLSASSWMISTVRCIAASLNLGCHGRVVADFIWNQPLLATTWSELLGSHPAGDMTGCFSPLLWIFCSTGSVSKPCTPGEHQNSW